MKKFLFIFSLLFFSLGSTSAFAYDFQISSGYTAPGTTTIVEIDSGVIPMPYDLGLSGSMILYNDSSGLNAKGRTVGTMSEICNPAKTHCSVAPNDFTGGSINQTDTYRIRFLQGSNDWFSNSFQLNGSWQFINFESAPTSGAVYPMDTQVQGGFEDLLTSFVIGAFLIIVVAIGIVGSLWLTKKLVAILLRWFKRFNQ